jgi:hypothetical protein
VSLDLYQDAISRNLSEMAPVQNVDPGMFDGFIRGTGMATMKGFAKAARAVDLMGSVGPIVQDAFTGGTEAQDKYFAEHDAVFGRAVDYWTPRSNEIGMAGEVMGGLMSVLPQVIVSPGLAVATTQLGTAEDLANMGVTTGKAQAVGAVQGLTLGTGIWMPILGKNLWQRAVIGGAGFNLVQGTGARAVSGAILDGTPAADMFKAFDGEAMTLDILMGLAFGGLVHYSPTQRAQGAKAWDQIDAWARNLKPSDKAAIATLREAQHLNVDSTPGKPVGTPDIEAHVERMRAAIDQLTTDQPVNVEDIKKETGVPPIRTIGVPIRIEGNDPKTVTYSRLDDGRLERTITYDDGDTQTAQLANKANGDEVWVSREGYQRGNFFPKQLDEGEAAKAAAEDAESMGAPRIERQPEAPRFEPDPERTAQAEATARDLQAAAETVRAEEGIPPPPQEPPRVVQSVRRTIEEELARAGRPAEEAAAGAAIWDAFYTTMARRIGTTVDQLWAQFPLPRITREAPGTEALKQGPNGDPVITVAGKDRPITNAEGKRIAADVEELKAFWNWFKDSEVVDKSGKPLVVYHGTNADFGAFNRDALGSATNAKSSALGFYFTDSTEVARTFAIGEGGNVMPVMLRIKNPIEIGFRTQAERKRAQPGQDPFDELHRAIAKIAGKESWKDVTTADVVAWKDLLESKGYDGVILRNTGMDAMPRSIAEPYHDFYIAFDPTQIKSAIGNRGTFDPKNPDILFQDKRNTWYTSALGEAIDKLNMKAAPAKGWLEALKGLGSKGVKADEVKWSGIEEWLQMQEGRVTKEQVQEFLANNGVKVEEVMLGGPGGKNLGDPVIADDIAILKRHGFDPEQSPDDASMLAFQDNMPDEDGNVTGDIITSEEIAQYAKDDKSLQEAADAARRIEQYWYRDSTQASPPKYGTYQLPGGTNYRELLLTLPKREAAIDTKVIAALTAEWNAWREARQIPPVSADEIPKTVWDRLTEEEQRYTYDFRDRWDSAQEAALREAGVFQSSHFDQPNILAHVRFNERTDADGKKVLFIEEFQSDWAQKGKREGFKKPDAVATVTETDTPRGTIFNAVVDGETIGAWSDRAQAQAMADAEARARAGTGIPAAPFVGKTDAWVSLALKRMITYAAENGFDRVAWTRGEQQVERYTGALRKAVDVIEWKKTPEGVQLVGYKGPPGKMTVAERARMEELSSRQTRGEELNLDDQLELIELIDRDAGKRQGSQKVVDTTEKEDALSDAIGKAMAEKIISDPNQSGTIEGDGIRIDSTGMAGFYDRIVPKVANDVLKKLGGGKVNEATLETGSINRQGVARRDDGTYSIINLDANVGAANEYTGRFDTPQEAEAAMHAATKTEQMAFDITPAMKAKVDGGLPLFQKTKGTERGYMSIGDEGRIIGLLEGADASTFIHESGHFFLETMAEICKLPDVPAAVRADLDTALTWMGLKDPAKWVDMTLDEKRPYHEKYARGFEQYMREGKAPSDELKGVFQRFRDWLVELYKSAKSLNVKLNDDIRGVLNRMLADQTRNPSTEAPPAPSERTGSPPPPRSGGEAQAGAEVPLIDQPPIRTILQGIADNETGWAQIGGRLMDQSELGTGKPSFTTWIPKAEWWRDRPDKKMNGPQAQEAVRKALAGEKLKPIEQRMVDFMLTMADERSRGLDQVGGPEEYDALALNAYDEGLEPTTQNVVDVDLVARAAAIDEAAVERAALQYENDDAAFRGEMEMIIYEAERTQAAEAAGRSKAGEQAPAGGQEGQAYKPGDIVRNEADLIVQNNPDMPITVGTNPDGTPMTMTAKAFLEQARAEAQMNRDDIPLLEVAAQCLFGRS